MEQPQQERAALYQIPDLAATYAVSTGQLPMVEARVIPPARPGVDPGQEFHKGGGAASESANNRVVTGTIVGHAVGVQHGSLEINALHQPGFVNAVSPEGPSYRTGRLRDTRLFRYCLAVGVGALLCGAIVALVAATGANDEERAVVAPGALASTADSSSDDMIGGCTAQQIVHGALVVDDDASQVGSSTMVDGQAFDVGHAVRVVCDPGFGSEEGVNLVVCHRSTSGLGKWSVELDQFPGCELLPQPPPPPPLVIRVQTHVYTQDEQEVAEAEVVAALAEASTAAAPPEVVDIASSVTLALSLDDISEAGTSERQLFEQSFIDSMADTLGGVSHDSLRLQSISGGSVVVEWLLVAPASVAEQAASLVATLAAASVAPTIELVVGGSTIGADMRSIAAPVVTKAPDVNCEGTWTACTESCETVFAVTVTAAGAGRPCRAEHGFSRRCSAGAGACPRPTVSSPAPTPPPPPSLTEWCDESPQQLCRHLCPDPACPDRQCAMRYGSCCDIRCQTPRDPSVESPDDTVMDSSRCAALCSDEGHCCQDHEVGSNQLISCAQACHIRERGTNYDTCISLCDERAETRGCSTTFNGHTYNHCQSCSDLHDGCPHGVQDVGSCYRGCAIAGGQRPPPSSVSPEPTPAPPPETVPGGQEHSCLSRVATIDFESVAAIDMVMFEYQDGSETAVHDPDASGPHEAAYARNVETAVRCDLYISRVQWVDFIRHGWMGRELHYELRDANGALVQTIEQRGGYTAECADDTWAQDTMGGCIMRGDFAAPEGTAIVDLVWSNDGRLTGVETEPLALGGGQQPPPSVTRPCRMGEGACGGQIWNECGSSCPGVCGERLSQMCNEMCVPSYQCPPSRPMWDEGASSCTVAAECSGLLGHNSTGPGTLPPGVAIGRPFSNDLGWMRDTFKGRIEPTQAQPRSAASESSGVDNMSPPPAVTARAVQLVSDWIGCDV